METRKQVTFLERDPVSQDLQQSRRTRTLGDNFPKSHDSTVSPLTDKVTEVNEWKAREYRVKLQQVSLSPRLKTIHIPTSVENASFLQHPDLKIGQKRYLYSIAKIYSTEQTHRLMQRQYLSMLQHRTQLGYISPHECQKYTDYLSKEFQKEIWKQSSSRLSTAQSSVEQSPAPQSGRPLFLPNLEDNRQRLRSRAPTKVNLKAKRTQFQVNRSEQI
ncbi:protein FAM216A isoform X1 [Scyliorhinus canicula]|uniref:protein FAM216A isoform X1 n=1 Tax=Scyliorhinus canicula TaxID=7830 RepID=UPI0018F4A2C2|nr:protein FAM216A isoform X1 [Scyliorhinus canicula]